MADYYAKASFTIAAHTLNDDTSGLFNPRPGDILSIPLATAGHDGLAAVYIRPSPHSLPFSTRPKTPWHTLGTPAVSVLDERGWIW